MGRRLATERGIGSVVRRRPDKGVTIMRRVGYLPTFLMREATVGTVANSVAVYGVKLAEVVGRTLVSANTVAAETV